MKALGLFGSPRRNGNTDWLLEEFLKGATSVDAKVERIYISDLEITPCDAALRCRNTGMCGRADDMQEVYPELLSADIIALAAPIFFYHLPAQTKALIDRCQALWIKKYILKIPPPYRTGHGTPRQGFFISVGGTKGTKLFEGAILTVKYFFDIIGVTYAGELLFRKIDTKGAIRKHRTALTEAFNWGRDLVTKKHDK